MILNMKIKTLEFIGEKLRPIELRLLMKAALGIKRKIIQLPDGRFYEIDPISDLGLKLLKNNEYEPKMTKMIKEILKEGDTFVDLGCNEGYFAVLAGKLCGKNGKVFAIEPQRRLWNIIDQNIFLNGLTNCQLLPYGIGSKDGEQLLQLYPSTNTGASSFSKDLNFKISFGRIRKKIYGTQIAKIYMLDNFMSSLSKSAKLIKIDIEGFEYEALKGAKKLLKNHFFSNLLIEIHEEALHGMGQSELDVDKILKKHGYTKQKVSSNLNLYMIV